MVFNADPFHKKIKRNKKFFKKSLKKCKILLSFFFRRKEYGATFDRQIQSAKNLAHATLGKEFINDTLLQDGSRLGDNPQVIKAFVNLANKLSEDTIVKGDQVPYLTVPEINKQIAALQQPGSAYWDKNNPNHSSAVEEVQALIRKKNNEENVE